MSGVLTGLEHLMRGGARAVGLSAGARIALLAHPASIDGAGHHVLERLAAPGELHVVRVFAPEHGLYGHEQDMEAVGEARDPATRAPVVSLYGTTAATLRPDPALLRDLDAVVCDLQDVGSRYYTFVYTLSLLMEEAARVGLRVIVLDRPNPIGGVAIEGPVLDPALASFVGRYPLPVRHGMTIGELARLFNEAYGIGCSLHVVPLSGWRRAMRFADTGLPWVPPSPNMPTPLTALVYPGACLVEGTNVSEGRGTTTPFELVGAPWLDGLALARTLRAALAPETSGVAFRAASFRPMFQKHAGVPCQGVQVLVRDADVFRPFDVYLRVLHAIREQDRAAFDWRREPYEFESTRLAIDLLLGRSDLRPVLERDTLAAHPEDQWRDDLARFDALRRDFLLYD